MERLLLRKLLQWKNSNYRKPLILRGARQVGKTWIMKEFGRSYYDQFIYLNFESQPILKNIFEPDFNLNRILSSFEVETGIKLTHNSLIILDEIQEASKGLMALKYFYESAPHLHIIAAGSYLGMSLQKLHNFPVGKVDFLEMYPMNFEEFLLNSGEQMLIGYLKSGNREVVNTFHERLTQLLRVYYYTGGMPEVVLAYFNTKDFAMVRQLQSNILTGYENDFGKYAPANIFTRIRMIWNSIPAQLAKDNRKFMYSMLKKGGRAAEFETALQWLSDAGLVRKALCVTKPSVPLSSYLNTNAFKLFLLDIGLLQAMSAVDHRILLDKNKILTEYKGAMTEQYVAQQLAGQYGLFYWTAPKGTAEIDFLIQHKDSIIPIEVKAEENLKSKSLKVYTDKFSPHTSVRISMSPYREESWLTNIPLYEVPFLSILVDLS